MFSLISILLLLALLPIEERFVLLAEGVLLSGVAAVGTIPLSPCPVGGATGCTGELFGSLINCGV